ncbi:MAG: D-alanyl-D-alanine carboxypeptidase [Candidatus Levybacteria bacterium]|nr:D-alanyl-D-alanine carboxypeptidase [Candidatus Levybacteria bacterium]
MRTVQRMWLFSIFFLIIFIATASFWAFKPAFSEEKTVVSPLPPDLTLEKNSQVRLLDFWKPLFAKLSANDVSLAKTAKAALLFDLTTDKTLFEKNSTDRLPMASLAKIMTAIVALENPESSDKYVVTEEDMVGEDSMGLTPGESVSLEELIYGLMLPSGNDAAEVLANNFSGRREAFIKAMNLKAKALGLGDTNFTNPSGLQGDGDQYTTASDLVVITKYALENFPLFRRVVSAFTHEIPATDMHKYFYLENATNLITSYPGVKGVKTGFTPEAGMCLVTYLEYDGHKIIGVLLNSENRRQEMKDLLDDGLKTLGVTPPKHD